jgi:hypothetical protein
MRRRNHCDALYHHNNHAQTYNYHHKQKEKT